MDGASRDGGQVPRRMPRREDDLVLKQRLELAVEAAGIGVWDWNLRTDQVVWDRRMYEIYGLNGDGPVPYGTWRGALLPEDLPGAEAALRRVIETQERQVSEYRIARPDGAVCHIHAAMALIRDGEGRPLRVVGINRDISATRRLQQRLEEQAFTDPLTGLLNRRGFDDRGRQDTARSSRYGRKVSLLVICVDEFRELNAHYGRPMGDAVLMALARRIDDTVRAPDSPARLDGGTFAVLLPETGLADASAMAERLRAAVETLQVTHQDETAYFTVSIGVAEAEPGDTGIEPLNRRVDEALRDAMRAGKNRVVTVRAMEA